MPTRPLSHEQRQRAAKQRVYAQHYEEQVRSKTPDLALAAKLRSTARWRKVRAIKLSRNPLCENPSGRHGPMVVATEVDHIVPLRHAPERAFMLDNLMSLCTKCHALKSACERRGDTPS